MKNIQGVYQSPAPHWVGDGFRVRSLFSYDDLARHISPFLLLDYAAPHHFSPTHERRGVGQHPHRGFETVTIVYQGELEHRDSSGAGGLIGPGDVQWMTAAGGIIHEEFHAPSFAESGGMMEMVQLWVNLPARDKSAPPGYQTLLSTDIPAVRLPDDAGSLRVIAGRYQGNQGPARTFTPIEVWDLKLAAGKGVCLTSGEDHNAALVVLRGKVRVNGAQTVGATQLVLFEREGVDVQLQADGDAMLLWLSGKPLDEPVVGYGPFVMNSEAEIVQAFDDFHAGRFGRLDTQA